MKKIELQILGISSGHSNASYTIILEEKGGERKLPVVIGAFEAQAIAIQIEKIVPPRPMTHDLFKSLATSFNIKAQEVIIHKLHEGVFYANIICRDSKNKVHEIDGRTSDAIALALRFNCPIYTYESIMQEAGVILSEPGEGEFKTQQSMGSQQQSKTGKKQVENLEELSLEKLKKKLDEAIKVENYIQAAKMRDEIKKREGEKK